MKRNSTTYAVIYLLAVYLFTFPHRIKAQDQSRILFLYNISFAAATTTIGALINKPKDQRALRVILRSFTIGAASGSLLYTSKNINFLIYERQNFYYGWPSRFLHNAATSLMENAAMNRKFLRNWHFDLGPFRIDIRTDDSRSITSRLYPISIYSIASGLPMNLSPSCRLTRLQVLL
ncbi:MAG: hypothetical protein ACK40G_11225 [Cytophagaceae bacterium]